MVPNLLNIIAVLSTLSGVICQGLQDVNSLQFCNKLGCANNSSCRTIFTENPNEGSHVTHSECICHGGWVGARCNHRLSLKVEYIQGHVATLTAKIITGSGAKTIKPKKKMYRYRYKIQYWSNETGSLCNIMTDLKSKRFTVTGLLPERFYFVCASAVTVDVDLCFYKDNDMLSIWPNCVLLNTLRSGESLKNQDDDTQGVVAPISLTVFFVIVLVLFIVVVIKCRKARCRREDFDFRNLLRPTNTCSCLSKRRTESTEEPQTSSRLLPVHGQQSRDRVIGPYGGHRRQKKHANSNGSVSYATRNDVRIPLTTIIEYTPEDLTETVENSLVIPEETMASGEKT